MTKSKGTPLAKLGLQDIDVSELEDHRMVGMGRIKMTLHEKLAASGP